MYADVVTHEAQRSLGFSISVYHQAWMDREALAALSNASRPEDVDQCSPGRDASEPERVCVLAVVRFHGHLAAEPMTVFSYAGADQDPLATVELPPTAEGVVAIWLPAKSVAPLFVRVMMDELTSGHSAEGDYSYKMHVATHVFLLPKSEPTSLAESQAIATQLDSITAEMVHAPLQWQDCGLQTDMHLLHMTQYSHSPDPIIDGSTRINRNTWRSSATWAIRNLTEIKRFTGRTEQEFGSNISRTTFLRVIHTANIRTTQRTPVALCAQFVRAVRSQSLTRTHRRVTTIRRIVQWDMCGRSASSLAVRRWCITSHRLLILSLAVGLLLLSVKSV